MQYNVYIKTESDEITIRNLSDDALSKVVDAYNLGKSFFFISGDKYSLENLLSIKIYTFDKPEIYNEVLKQPDVKGKLKLGNNDRFILAPYVLSKLGDNVTENYIKGDVGYLNQLQHNIEIGMDIFISHSSQDEKVAECIIELIRTALNIEASKIRCTSVNGYRLPSGADTIERIKKEVNGCKVLVVLISEHSIKSAFVMFELGARWGLSKPLIPLIISTQGSKLLEGPLSVINALNAHDQGQVHQFLNDLANTLNIRPENPAVYLNKITSLSGLLAGKESGQS